MKHKDDCPECDGKNKTCESYSGKEGDKGLCIWRTIYLQNQEQNLKNQKMKNKKNQDEKFPEYLKPGAHLNLSYISTIVGSAKGVKCLESLIHGHIGPAIGYGIATACFAGCGIGFYNIAGAEYEEDKERQSEDKIKFLNEEAADLFPEDERLVEIKSIERRWNLVTVKGLDKNGVEQGFLHDYDNGKLAWVREQGEQK